jgi:hypothetical protein
VVLPCAVGVLAAALLLACGKENRSQARATPSAASSSVDIVRGHDFTLTTRCQFHPNETLESVSKTLPSGSVDTVLVQYPLDGLVLVVVEVTVDPHVPSGPRSFDTSFRLSTGGEVTKSWVAATGNKSSTFRAVMAVPAGARHFRTVPVTERAG